MQAAGRICRQRAGTPIASLWFWLSWLASNPRQGQVARRKRGGRQQADASWATDSPAWRRVR
jgi:hypothetical protein